MYMNLCKQPNMESESLDTLLQLLIIGLNKQGLEQLDGNAKNV
jgi:hypothetical protein